MHSNDTDNRNVSGDQCLCTSAVSFKGDQFSDLAFAGTWGTALLSTLIFCGVITLSAWRVWDKQPAYFLLLINFCIAQVLQALCWFCLVIANFVPDHLEPNSPCNSTVRNSIGFNAGQVAGTIGRLTSFTSLLIKTAISVELYCYFCRALQYNKAHALQRAKTLIIGAWVVGLVLAAGYFIWPSAQTNTQLLNLQVFYLTRMDMTWWCTTIVMLVICGSILVTANICITMSTCNIISRDHQNQVTMKQIHKRNKVSISGLVVSNTHSSLQRVPEVPEAICDDRNEYLDPAVTARSPSQCSIRSQVMVQIMPNSPTNTSGNTIGVVVSHELPVGGQASSISTCCSIENNDLYLNSNGFKKPSQGDQHNMCRAGGLNTIQGTMTSHSMIPRIEVISPSTIGCGSSCSDKTSTYRQGSITTCGEDFSVSMSSTMTGGLRSYGRHAQVLQQENNDSQSEASEVKSPGKTLNKKKGYLTRQPSEGEPQGIETMQGNAKVNNWFSNEGAFEKKQEGNKQQNNNKETSQSETAPQQHNTARLGHSQSLSGLSILEFLMQDGPNRDNRGSTNQGEEPQMSALRRFSEGGEGLEEEAVEETAPSGSLGMRLTAIVARFIYILVLFSGQWVSPFVMLGLQANLCPPPEWSYKLWWTLMLVISPLQIAYYAALNKDIARAIRHFRLPCHKSRIHPTEEDAATA